MAKGDKSFAALANAAHLTTSDAVQSRFRIIFTIDGYNGTLASSNMKDLSMAAAKMNPLSFSS